MSDHDYGCLECGKAICPHVRETLDAIRTRSANLDTELASARNRLRAYEHHLDAASDKTLARSDFFVKVLAVGDATPCACGEPVHLLRRGRFVKLPAGHRCPYREAQQNILRTQRVCMSIGSPMWTDAELARELAEAMRP